MAKDTAVTNLKDGWIKRKVGSGRFVAVGTGKTVTRASAKTERATQEASAKRNAALKRLADR